MREVYAPAGFAAWRCGKLGERLGAIGDRMAQGDRPAHLQWRYIVLVAAGGAVGTALRAALSSLIPDPGVFPTTVFAINLVGAFVLGLLLEALERSGPDEGARVSARLLVGTGVLGGFTTYSALATATAELATAGQAGAAVAYALGTVVLGAVASVAGIAVARVMTRRRGATS